MSTVILERIEADGFSYTIDSFPTGVLASLPVGQARVRPTPFSLRSVPDQAGAELRLSLPSVLWPSRLRGN